MAANAPSLPAKAFPVISIREASKKDSEQHLLCAALAREILERAGEHNGNNLRPPASIATKILAARAVRPDLSAQEAFAVFDPVSFLGASGGAAEEEVEDEGAAAAPPAAVGSKRCRAEASSSGAAEAEDEAEDQAAEGGEGGDGGEAEADRDGSGEGEEEGRDEAAAAAAEGGAEQEADDGSAAEGGGGAQGGGAEGEGGGEQYDDTYVPPERDESRIRFQTRIVNEHLVCTLCMGYFNDACTIIECLHTFCRACIMRHFKEYSICPQCENDCGPNPRDIVRTDRTLQSIVDKIFPQFVKPSAPAPAPAPAADAEHKVGSGAGAAGSGATGSGAAAEASPEEISFSLHEIEGSSRGHGKLDKPYLRTKALLTVAHLKKYLGRKTGLPAEVPIDIFCRDAPLENGLTLEQIVRTLWCDEDNDLVLYYRVL